VWARLIKGRLLRMRLTYHLSIAIGMVVAAVLTCTGVAAAASAAAPLAITSISARSAGGLTNPAAGAKVVVTVRVRGATSCTFLRQYSSFSSLYVFKTINCAAGSASATLPPIANTSRAQVTLHYVVRVRSAGGVRVQRSVTLRQSANQAPRAPSPTPSPTPNPAPTAALSITSTSVSSSGGLVVLAYVSTNATTCSLSSSPAFWVGSNPTAVNCTGTYNATVPASSSQKQWTFTFTATDSAGESASATQTLTEGAPTPAPVPTGGSSQSTNWSGYALSGAFTTVIGTFNVPNLTQASTETSTAEWVGVDGVTNTSLIQAGVSEDYSPTTNKVQIYAWWEILPDASVTISPLLVAPSPGDAITITISEQSPGVWGIRVSDDTKGQTFTTVKSYTGPTTSAEWIVEAPTGSDGSTQLTLGQYVPNVTFTNVRYTGTATAGSLTRIAMVQGGLTLSTPSALSTNGFTVAYGGAVPPPP
jgi:hypothetical protein